MKISPRVSISGDSVYVDLLVNGELTNEYSFRFLIDDLIAGFIDGMGDADGLFTDEEAIEEADKIIKTLDKAALDLDNCIVEPEDNEEAA
jgi:hypothetical protein